MGQIRRQIIVAGAAPVPIRLSASNRTVLRNDGGSIVTPTGAQYKYRLPARFIRY